MADNKLPLSDILPKEYIGALYDSMIMNGLVSSEYTTAFSNPKVGETVRIKRANTFQAFDWSQPSDTVVQSADVTTNTISIDRMIDCTFEITTKEWTFYVNEFLQDFFVPAVKAVAEQMDSHILAKMYAGTQKVVAGVTGVTSVADLAKINKAAKQMKIASGSKIALVGLTTEALMLGSIPELIHADKRADAGVHFRAADIGFAMDVAYYSSDKIDDMYAGLEVSTLVDGAATVLVDAKKYDETITLTGAASGAVVGAGQILKVGTHYFTAASRAVANSSGVIVIKTTGLTEDIDAGVATVTKVIAGSNFLFAKDAVNVVTVVPALPASLIYAQVLTDAESGFGMRYYIVPQFGAGDTKSDLFRMDTYIGAKVTDPRRIARF